MYALALVLTLISQKPEISLDGLSEQQKAELQLQAARMKAEIPGETLRQTKEWVELGSAVGQALGGSARELGIATNEFATTPVGQMAAVLIIWKVMGRDVVHIGLGISMVLFLLPCWWYFWRRAFVIKSIAYGDSKTDGYRKKVLLFDANDRKAMGEGHAVAKFVFGMFGPAIVVAAVLIMLF